jgi:outer membrane protein assembly factor BamB
MKTISYFCLLIMALFAHAAFAEVPKLPDLDVTYIQRLPRNMGVAFTYPNDIPTPACQCLTQPQPGKGPFKYTPHQKKISTPPEEITVEEMKTACLHAPYPGQKVKFIAHVINHGGISAPAAPYEFLMDGKSMMKGKLPELKQGEEATVSCDWKWKDGDHVVEFKITPTTEEICRKNDSRADRTNAIALTQKAFSKEVYDAFCNTPNQIGSYSFEDWAQYHIDVWNDKLAKAVYPSTPNGVTERIRFDGVYPPDSPDLKKRAEQGEEWTNWTFNWDIADIPRYAKTVDTNLIHELCHQCGIIDIYMISLQAQDNLVKRDDGKYVFIGGYPDQPCQMSNPPAYNPNTIFSEHTAGAFERMKGWPRWGYGLYLFDIPEHNIVRILDNRGNPIPGAKVLLHFQIAGFEISSNKMMGKIPPRNYITDSKGEADFGDFPFEKVHVVGWSGMDMLEIKANNQTEYHFLDVTQMNVAYWRGDEKSHTYIIKTGIAQENSPAPPTQLEAKLVANNKVRLSWRTEKNPKSFHILYSAANMSCSLEPPFIKVAELPGTSRDVELIGFGTYAISAIDEEGKESAYSNTVIVPDYNLFGPIPLSYGTVASDGTIYTFHVGQGLLMSLDTKGKMTNWKDTFSLDSGYGVSIALSPDEKTLYIAGEPSHVIYVIDLVEKKKIIAQFGENDLKGPTDVKTSKDGTIFVADTKGQEVVIFNKDGKKIGSIGGFEAPRCVAYNDALGLIAVGDRKVKDIKLFTYKDGKAEPAKTIETDQGNISVAFGPENRIYAGSAQGGFVVYDMEGKKLGRWFSKPFASSGSNVESINIMPDGTVYVAQGVWYLKVLPEEIEWVK